VNPRFTMLFIAVALVAAFAVGCGGDDDGDAAGAPAQSASSAADAGDDGNAAPEDSDSGSSTGGEADGAKPTPTKAAFIGEGKALCDVIINEALSDVPNLYEDKVPSEEIAEEIDSKLLPAFEEVISGLEALGAPAGDEAEVEAVIDALKQDVARMAESSSSFDSWSDLAPYFERSTMLARRYGLGKCTYAN
jgi:hypothetical protein